MVILAEHAGFCFGVKRAVEAVEKNLDKKIVTLGKLIHNESAVHSLEQKGIRCVKNIEEIEPGETVVIRSHGVTPSVYDELEKKGISYIDATCTYVKRIHERVREAREAGQSVIIIGESGHPEVVGTMGWAGENSYIVYTRDDVKELPKIKEAVVVAQTTITESKWDELIEALKDRVDTVIPFMSICSATLERQREAEEIAKKSDIIIVVGGKQSSNTQKLYELCRKYCEKVFYIEQYKELSLEKMHGGDIIGIVAGASTPDWIIREVFDCMSEIEKVLPAEDGEVMASEAAADTAEESADVADTAAGESDMALEETEITSEPEQEELTGESETETEIAAEDETQVSPEDNAEPAENEQATAAENAGEQKPPTEKDEFLQGLENVVRLRKGQIITGTVVQITDDDVSVNIGYKSDGIIHKEELSLHEINPREVFKEGDEIEAEVISLNDGEGNVLLSRKKIEKKQNWLKIKEFVGTDKVYKCVVRKAVKGGVTTKIEGFSAFIPASHIALKYIEDLKQFEGKEIEVMLIDADKRQERLVASHKNVLMKEKREKEDQVWSSFSKGDHVKGTVKRLTEFGAFVDVGGVDGLLHISDMAWSRVRHPSDVVSEGQELELLVLSVDTAKKKIALGYKQLQPKPWDTVSVRYQAGDVVTGKVVRIVPFGAFVQLEPTIDGLIHISQVSKRRLERVEDELKIGDEVEVKILDVNADKRKISLSRRVLLADEPRPEKKERIESDDDFRYEIPPVQESKVSLADFFPKKSDEE